MDDTDALRVSVCTNSALRRATRRIGQLYDDALAPVGLRATQYSILSQIERAGGEPLVGRMAELLVMDLSALGHTLRALQKDGLVEVRPDENDRRSRRVRLTRAGRARLKQARVLWDGAHRRFEETFGADNAHQLRAVLDAIASPDFAERFGEQS
ncbi:MarR family winged helix-turn-helix transcriptional regulator [Bordetella genomosp. 13]|uniref:MarR family winged helix-turn-helix transcriptional regulator n=1 Tax=Bordetella genomosp. 13 TaxID=463040 RepID=UPI0011A2303D|nr:MarR family winged helix-turn-helix transcriptional regulator [Bordetella genomosp. 13]